MPQVINRSGEMQGAVKKSNHFCETVFKHVITTVAVYGKVLKQQAGETSSVPVLGMKPPKTALNQAAQRLCYLASQLRINLENSCSVADITRCLKLASTTTPYANVLMKASFNIFQSYEKLLMSVDEDDLTVYARLVGEKILKDYVTASEFTEKTITAAVFSNKYSYKSLLHCCYGEFIDAVFKIKPDESMSKFDKYLTKAGVFTDGILYERDISNSSKYHFRRLFDAETENPEFFRHFTVNNKIEINYSYIMSEPMKQKCLQELINHMARIRLQEIDFKTEVEAKIANVKEEIKILKKNYRLKLMEEFTDSIDNLDGSIQEMIASNSSAEATRRNDTENPRSQSKNGVHNDVKATKIGVWNQTNRL
ncbi:hypothetical protein CBL_10856 [Carabus blaptoides fortunei]